MDAEKQGSGPVLGLTEEEFDALDPKEQLSYLVRVLLEFDRRYKKWLARQKAPTNAQSEPTRDGRSAH